MNLHQPANFHFFANGMHLYVIYQFVPIFELGFIAYYSLHYYHDGVNGDLGYRALSTVGVTFGHWVNQVARNLFVNMECFYVFINC
ncbi:hypothetical protein Hanom_Chr00s141531g01819221 [Helianthus anomalus]